MFLWCAAEPSAQATFGPKVVPGLIGQALLVDSADHEFRFRTEKTFNPTRGTVEFWVQPQREIGKEDFEGTLYRTIDPASTSEGVQVFFHHKGIEVNTRYSAGWDVARLFPVQFAAKSWHHIALTWNGHSGRFYVDGKSMGEFPMKTMTGCDARTYLGALRGQYVAMSAFDELRLSNTDLTAEQIQKDYEAGRKQQPLVEVAGQTLLLNHCDGLPTQTTVRTTTRVRVRPSADGHPQTDPNPIDALGPTDWLQGQWPSDPTMPNPNYPRFCVTPVSRKDTGVTFTKCYPMEKELTGPTATLSLETPGGKTPLYRGTSSSQIAYRVGNLLRLVDTSAPVERSVEMMVVSQRLVLVRIKLFGAAQCHVRLDIASQSTHPKAADQSDSRLRVVASDAGWCGFDFVPGTTPGETLLVAVYDATNREQLLSELDQARKKTRDFDSLWKELARPHSIEPFLIGGETPTERNLVAACVNRVLCNARTGGKIRAPSMVEFFGPGWPGGDMVWICFQPACRYALWIEPSFWANSMRTLFGQQTSDGMVPQFVGSNTVDGVTQIPNISPVVRDYYLFTHDRAFLEQAYPALKRWYAWFLTHRNPSHDGIFAVGDASLTLWDSLCEYKDDGTDPTKPTFFDTCNPLTRTAEIAGRPERVYLPDIVACQARMAEDLAMMAGELGLKDDAAHFNAEYRRVRDWANHNLWDEKTRFYYPVVRATGKKLMKRSNTAFWLLWAGIPSKDQKDALVAAMFDPKQFFTTIPLPGIALNDPTFNPRCGHWGDGYCWPLDCFHAFDGLLRYGEWKRAAQLATQYNHGVFRAIESSYQPNEYYHHTGQPAGCGEMATAGCLPLVFQRYLRDYKDGKAKTEWRRFAPEPLF
jgi:hypothetical protein